MSVTIGQGGQVTLPQPILDRLGLKPGDAVDVEATADGRIMVARAGAAPSSRFASLVGAAGPGLSTDEIMAMTRGDD